MKYIYNDGGRAAAGYQGNTGDCVTRAVAIATGLPYQEVYDALGEGSRNERMSTKSSARSGVHTKRKWFKDYMAKLGWKYTPTMGIGTGCKVHLREDELPNGRLVVQVSKHYTAVIDGIIHDTFDPQRLPFGTDADKEDIGGTRCVYGYWSKVIALGNHKAKQDTVTDTLSV